MDTPEPIRHATRTAFPLVDRFRVRPSAAAPTIEPMVAALLPPSVANGAAGETGDASLVLLRSFSAHLQDFRDLLTSVTSGNASFEDYQQYSTDWLTNGDGFLTRIEAEQVAGTSAVDGDAVIRIRQRWARIKLSPLIAAPPTGALTQDQLRQLTMLDDLCQSIVFDLGWVTVPKRLNTWLSGARSGYYIPFHQVFVDEIPDEQDRIKLLNYLAAAPRAVEGGLIDRGTGLIYRYSKQLPWQLASLLGVIIAFAVATWLVIALCRVGSPGVNLGFATVQMNGWPLTEANIPSLLGAWLALLVGIAVHLGVGAAKQMRERPTEPPVLSAFDVLPVINAKFGPILLKLFTALIGLFAIVATQGIAAVTPFTAFLFGYSLDSVVELVGTNLDKRAAAQTASLRG